VITSDIFDYEEVKGLRFPTSLFGQSKAYSHIYYVDGLLIDTGHQRKRKTIIQAVDLLAVDQIFITHHHEDHTGNLKVLKDKISCDAFASPACCELMKDPPKLSVAQKLYWGTRPAQDNLVPIEGQIKTKNFQFDIIPIPGHADDMVALYEPKKKWLFSADLFIHHKIGYYISTESMKQQISSIRRVLELDFDVMFCAHNPQLKNGKQKLQSKLDYFEEFFEKVSTLHQKGLSANQIFKEMNLKEIHTIKTLSNGYLSKMNMVRSVIRDITE
jgi:ribonuclease/clavin/mitogillin